MRKRNIISVEYDVLVDEYNNNVYDDAEQILEKCIQMQAQDILIF